MDLFELKQALASDALGVSQFLLPHGKKEGDEWRNGSTDPSDAGKSLGVHLRGNKAGVWSDFTTGERGDLIDLWKVVKGIPLALAISEAKAHIGFVEPAFTAQEKKYNRPSKPKCTAPEELVYNYLDSRLISGGAMKAYKVAQMVNKIIFPYMRDGELIFIKSREAIDGASPRPLEKDMEPCLFGWQAIPDDATEVTICEGEIDALTLWDYGFPAMSVPFGGGGGGKQNWINTEFANLDRFETIFLALDDDDVGRAATTEIINRLGAYRCRVVKLPHKDANECAKQGVTDLSEYFDKAKTVDPEELRPASEFLSEVLESFYPPDGEEPGYTTPWPKTNKLLRWRESKVSIWTGGTGMGKSQVLGHVMVDVVGQGAKVCIASLEMRPKLTLKRMVKQAGQVDRPTEEYLNNIFKYFEDQVWLFDLVGKAKLTRLLEIFEYARRRYGCNTFVIDSLMRLGIGKEDYEAQANAMYEIVDWANSRPVHVHLVAHSKEVD